MSGHKDTLRDRLQRLEVASRERRASARREPAALDDLEHVVERNGVLVLERDVGSLVSASARSCLLARRVAPAEATAVREDVEEALGELFRSPETALFIDTETTGLGSAMVFLLGVMRVTERGVTLQQIFARDYREESELLGRWAAMLEGARMLVSFNGKSFDMPVLRDRMGYHGIRSPSEPPHLDLLHASRRRWREALPDCRLQTLEWNVCGRRRSGDIPGEEIPAAYHRFVRTGDPSDMMSVLHHNALDLVTLADIATALALPDEDA